MPYVKFLVQVTTLPTFKNIFPDQNNLKRLRNQLQIRAATSPGRHAVLAGHSDQHAGVQPPTLGARRLCLQADERDLHAQLLRVCVLSNGMCNCVLLLYCLLCNVGLRHQNLSHLNRTHKKKKRK